MEDGWTPRRRYFAAILSTSRTYSERRRRADGYSGAYTHVAIYRKTRVNAFVAARCYARDLLVVHFLIHFRADLATRRLP